MIGSDGSQDYIYNAHLAHRHNNRLSPHIHSAHTWSTYVSTPSRAIINSPASLCCNDKGFVAIVIQYLKISLQLSSVRETYTRGYEIK